MVFVLLLVILNMSRGGCSRGEIGAMLAQRWLADVGLPTSAQRWPMFHLDVGPMSAADVGPMRMPMLGRRRPDVGMLSGNQCHG